MLDEDEDEDVETAVDERAMPAVGRLGGRRTVNVTLLGRDEAKEGFDGCVLVVGTPAAGRARLWVERDLTTPFCVEVCVSNGAVEGGNRARVEVAVREVFDELGGRATDEPSRSLFMELEVCAAYDGSCELEDEVDDDVAVVSPPLSS